MKKLSSILLSIVLLLSMPFFTFSTSAATQATAASSFTFSNGKMSKEVLRSYASRAVTHSDFCGSYKENPIFEEDLRFLRRIGAKYIGRATSISWSGGLTVEQLEDHYRIAEESAKAVHKADPEMILQAGIFEIAYRATVNNSKIPAHVFEAFGQPVEDRNFNWDKVVFQSGTYKPGFWGVPDSGVPDISQLETKMYFYYQITRYIDAGYEAFHMGQVEMMGGAGNNGSPGVRHWSELLEKARAYAKTHARRGLVLFDNHVGWNSPGFKIGNNLVFDIQGAPMFPNETEIETIGNETVRKAEIAQNSAYSMSYLGQIEGGRHPLGFDVENNFTIVEFDNFGPISNPGESNGTSHGTWGFDDVTWFATQPEWYRNEFLKYCDSYLSSHNLDSKGKQQYFLQPVTCRVITPGNEFAPELIYYPGEDVNVDFLFDYPYQSGSTVTPDGDKFIVTAQRNYRANRMGDGCPNGFNQEDTIREIFLGKGAKEDPELVKVVLPSKYRDSDEIVTPPSDEQTSSNGTSNGVNQKPSTGTSDNTQGNTPGADNGNQSNKPNSNSSSQSNKPNTNGNSQNNLPNGENTTDAPLSSEGESDQAPSDFPWIWVIIGAVALVLIAGGIVFYFLCFIKRQNQNKK